MIKAIKLILVALLQLDDERRDLQKQVEALREQRNAISAKMKGGRPDWVINWSCAIEN